MKKRKKIWIPIVSVLLVAAVGGGLALYFTQRPKAAVGVYDINQLSVMNYWGMKRPLPALSLPISFRRCTSLRLRR